MSEKAFDVDGLRRISELKILRPLRPCIDAGSILRVEGRLENAELPLDAKHPIILPSRHALTRLTRLCFMNTLRLPMQDLPIRL